MTFQIKMVTIKLKTSEMFVPVPIKALHGVPAVARFSQVPGQLVFTTLSLKIKGILIIIKLNSNKLIDYLLLIILPYLP